MPTPARWLLVLAQIGLGACHLGRPPLDAAGFVPGPVQQTSVEPGLADALRSALAASLAARGALGSAGRPLEVEVLTADAATVAASGASALQLWQARLVVAVSQAGAVPRRVVVQGAHAFTADPADPLATAAARAAAFEALARGLVQDAVDWHLHAPPARSGGQDDGR